MAEIASISVLVTAEVADALAGLRNVQKETKEMAAVTTASAGQMNTKLKTAGNVAAAETIKIEGFMGKWKMGWVAMGAAAIASLYAVAKSSAVIGGYFSEFGMIVGYVFDEIGIAMAPILQPLLQWLWDVARAFAALPEPVKVAVGAIIICGTALVTLIPILALFKTSLATLGLAGAFAALKAEIIAVGAGIKAALTALGIGVGAAFAILAVLIVGAIGIWYAYKTGVTKAMGDVIDEWGRAHPVLYDMIMAVTWPLQMLGAVAVAVMNGELRAIPGMLKGVWSDALAHWVSFREAFISGLAEAWPGAVEIIADAITTIRGLIDSLITKLAELPGIGGLLSKLSSYIGGGTTAGVAPLPAAEYAPVPTPALPAIGEYSEFISELNIATLDIQAAIETSTSAAFDEIARDFSGTTMGIQSVMGLFESSTGEYKSASGDIRKSNSIFQTATADYQKASMVMQDAGRFIVSELSGIGASLRSIPSMIMSLINSLIANAPAYQHGGPVRRSGLAMLHAGEYVMPVSSATGMPGSQHIEITNNFTITGGMNTELDVRHLADTVSRQIKDDIQRMLR